MLTGGGGVSNTFKDSWLEGMFIGLHHKGGQTRDRDVHMAGDFNSIFLSYTFILRSVLRFRRFLADVRGGVRCLLRDGPL